MGRITIEIGKLIYLRDVNEYGGVGIIKNGEVVIKTKWGYLEEDEEEK